eukprot:TRINITY_DN29991_c0_g1_i1.p1 TRINITY_DN29991_c0_g1~~TRINITY_DN29991_c0_g1_i1.p1  ORF type:complete len:299 (-),score=31.99 TRINITY_DN29991_c0_g1_i1:174-1028(-)
MPFVNPEHLVPDVCCIVFSEYHARSSLIDADRLPYDVVDAVPKTLDDLGVQQESWSHFLRDCLTLQSDMLDYARMRFRPDGSDEKVPSKRLCCCWPHRRGRLPPEAYLRRAPEFILSWSQKWSGITVQHHVVDELAARHLIMLCVDGELAVKAFEFPVPEGSEDLGSFILLGSRDRLDRDLQPQHLVTVLNKESHRSHRQYLSHQKAWSERPRTSTSETSVAGFELEPVVCLVPSKANLDREFSPEPESPRERVRFSPEDEVTTIRAISVPGTVTLLSEKDILE